MKNGTAPALTTAFVWSGVPEAMLVRAQAASNCRAGASLWPRNSTSLGDDCHGKTQEVGAPWQDPQVDHDIYGRVPLPAQDLPGTLGGLHGRKGSAGGEEIGGDRGWKVASKGQEMIG